MTYMINTVGSYENKHLQKKWIPIRKSLVLTSTQRAFIAGSLLGDGTMRLGKGAVNVNFKVEHGLKQKEYVEWKYQLLKPFVFTGPRLSYRYTESREKYAKSWWFRTIRHPILTEIYREFYEGIEYKNGKKRIPVNISDVLDPFAIAVWVMDDGSYNQKKIDVSTYAFSLSDILMLQKVMKLKFDIQMNFYQDRDKGCRMYCNTKETEKLVEIIRPYIIPSMMYKIGFVTP